jgi:hypothetical protein
MVDWTDEENDAIVANYFAMLATDISGVRYNKASYNRALQQLIGRPRGSIEYKHQNISAALMGLGEAWIPGYKPAINLQASLVEAVVRWLDAHPAWLTPQVHPDIEPSTAHESPALWIGPPPTYSNTPPPVDLEKTMGIAHKFDPAARDARNRALGLAGEQRVLLHERTALTVAGWQDLADCVRWVSDEDGDGAGFDIASFRPDGGDHLIEVKTTNGWERTPFHISRNELAVAGDRRDDWYLVRLWNFARKPTAFEIRPPLEDHVSLTPTGLQARLR